MNGFGWNDPGLGNVPFTHLNTANVAAGWGVIPPTALAAAAQPPASFHPAVPHGPPAALSAGFLPQNAAWPPGPAAPQHQYLTPWPHPSYLPGHVVPLPTHSAAINAALPPPSHLPPPPPASHLIESHQFLVPPSPSTIRPPLQPPQQLPPPPPPPILRNYQQQEPAGFPPAAGKSSIDSAVAAGGKQGVTDHEPVPTIPLRTPSPNSLRQKEEIMQLKSDDEMFEKRFGAWEDEFNQWKRENADSMDSAKFSYEREMIQMKEKLLSRRYALRCRLERKVAQFERRAPRSITPPPHMTATEVAMARDGDDRRCTERSVPLRSPSPGAQRSLPSYISDGFHGENRHFDVDYRTNTDLSSFLRSDRGAGSLSEAIDNVVDVFSRGGSRDNRLFDRAESRDRRPFDRTESRDKRPFDRIESRDRRAMDRFESRDRWSGDYRSSPPPSTADASWRDAGNRGDRDYRDRFPSPPGRRHFDDRPNRSRSPRRLMSPPMRRSPPPRSLGGGPGSPSRHHQFQGRFNRRQLSRSPPSFRRRHSRSPPDSRAAISRRYRSRSRSPMLSQRHARHRESRSPLAASASSLRVPSLMHRNRDRSPPHRFYNVAGDSRRRSPGGPSTRRYPSGTGSGPPPRTGPRLATPSVDIADLIRPPGRDTRPANLAIILRGLPGSGKTHVAKLIKDEEIGNKAGAPRILSLDDYFYVESEQKKSVSSTTSTASKSMEYEYDEAMEPAYRSALEKAFRKTVDDGLFHFIILDCINNRVKHFDSMAHYAVSHGFKVYVAELDTDVATCHQRNVHGRSLASIRHIHQREWEQTPARYTLLDLKNLLQDTAIQEVEMEDVVSSTDNENTDNVEQVAVSKWEQMDPSEERLDKLDGVMSARRRLDVHHTPQTMEDYLQLPDDYQQRQQLSSATGSKKKRVRWADVEERLQQQKARDVGFIVGQTDWSKMTGPDRAIDALEQTKYI